MKNYENLVCKKHTQVFNLIFESYACYSDSGPAFMVDGRVFIRYWSSIIKFNILIKKFKTS